MTFDFDYYSRFEKPSLLLCHPDDTPIGMLTDIEDYKLEIKLNEVSKLDFNIYQVSNIEYIPVPTGDITSSTVGTYFTYKIHDTSTGYSKGHYEKIELDGYTNDLTLDYFTEESSYNKAFDEIVERREIFVENIGYFIITDVEDNQGSNGRYKSVSASSCDYELNYIEMPYLDGTYILYSNSNWTPEGELTPNDYIYYADLYVTPMTVGRRWVREGGEWLQVTLPDDYQHDKTYYGRNDYIGKDCILYEIMKSVPHWTLKQSSEKGIASEDPDYVELASKYRTFNAEDGRTVYSFLKNDIQETFECFVKFDIINREIEICRYEDALTETDFILNADNFSNECKIKTTIDDYTNSLVVNSSDSDVYMSSVNPLGTSTIYNFKHDLESGFIVSEYEPVSVYPLKGWYFYKDNYGNYIPVYLESGNRSDEYDNTKQYYKPTEAGTLAAALTIWQMKFDDASIKYNGIDYSKWDEWCDELDRIKNWVSGDYYISSNKNGTNTSNSFLVVLEAVNIADSINTHRSLPIQWNTKYNESGYLLDPPPNVKDNGVDDPYYDVESVMLNGVDIKGQCEFIPSASTYTRGSECRFKILTTVSNDDEITITYNYVPAINKSNIKNYYNYYNTSVSKTVFDKNKSNYYVRGKYGFEPCTNKTYNANELYYMKADDSVVDEDGKPSVGKFIKRNDYKMVDPAVSDYDTYYSWNGAKFIEVAPKVKSDGSKEANLGTTYYVKVGDTENGISGKIDSIMSWINQNRGMLCDYEGKYDLVSSMNTDSLNIVTKRSEYAGITPSDTYGRIYCKSLSDNDFGSDSSGNLYITDRLKDFIEEHGITGPSASDRSNMYVLYQLPEIEYEKTEDGVPGVVDARLILSKIDLATEDVRSEAVNLITTISGYNAQILALQNITSSNIQPEQIENETAQIYGFIAEARANMVVANDKYRQLVADGNQLREQITQMSTGLSFETFFAQYYRDNGYTDETTIGNKAKELYSKLIRFLRQQSYTEENITIEDNMTSEERQDQELALYKHAVNLLEKLIEPTYELSIGIESFPFIENFSDITSKLDVGSIINIELQTGEVVEFNLVDIKIDFDDKKMDLTFGNHINRSDPASVFEDLQTSAASAASIVASNYVNWGAAADGTTQLLKERNSILDATLRGITTRNSSLKDNVSIDTSGIKCMTYKLSQDGEYVGDYGLWISNGVIMFTDDNWSSSKMAVGRMQDYNGNTFYGFNGDTILANTIAADKLVAGTLSSGNNMIKDGSFESYINDNPTSNPNYYFTADDPWKTASAVKTDAYVVTQSGISTNNSLDSNAYLGERYLLLDSGRELDYKIPINIQNSDVYTLSYYTELYGEPTEGSLSVSISDSNDNEVLSVCADYSEISDESWTRFNNTSTIETGSYKLIIKSTLNSPVKIDGLMLEQTSMINEFSGMPGENYSKYTIMDEGGLRVYGGNIKVFNTTGDKVVHADSNGNLTISGTLNASTGSNIAGWITSKYGFYKELRRNKDDPSTSYPSSGLFINDSNSKYYLSSDGFFSFDRPSQTSVGYNYPLLFTGYNGENPGTITSDTCNFYIDNNGYMKAVNATITGTFSNKTPIKTLNGNGGREYSFSILDSSINDFIVLVDDVIQPQASGNKNALNGDNTMGYDFSINKSSTPFNVTIKFRSSIPNGSKIKIYSGNSYGTNISYANIAQAKIISAAITNGVISDSNIGSSNINSSIINECEIYKSKIKNYIYFYSGNTRVARIQASTVLGSGTSTSATNLLIDATGGKIPIKDETGATVGTTDANSGNGSITIRAKKSNSSRKVTTITGWNDSDGNTATSDKIEKILKVVGREIGWGGAISAVVTATKTIEGYKPIYLDGDVYISGLSTMYGTTPTDVVGAFDDVYNKITTLSSKLNRLALLTISNMNVVLMGLGATYALALLK